ncbi:MAG: nitrophenyl compound nitroreductase subunit ArsF family protein [Candidatus Omnitrophica bacterium]|nr:nitrophenyl compound nitroreductase subunit ArsF family protein [Candidatus Omnitrophota bacterium]
MKKIFLVILAAVAVISASSLVFAAENKPAAKVVAYYFHGTFRCYTCTNMEKYSREAIEANFKDALTSGKLEFLSVNVEDRGNEHFVNDYQLYTKTLILSLVKDGKEVKSKNLDKIWEYARNEQKFIDYVTSEISGFMKDVQ